MTETLFLREGAAHNGRHHVNAKGQPVFTRERVCGRCGGAGGSDKWAHTGWNCFDCGGSGRRGTETIRLFTQAELDRLNATAAKRRATKLAKLAVIAAEAQAESEARRDAFLAEHGELLTRAEAFAERSDFIRDVTTKARQRNALSDAQAVALAEAVERIVAADAVKAASRHVGTIGERLQAEVTIVRSLAFPSQFGVMNITTMRDADGNCLVSKGRFSGERGERLTIKFTVKEHGEFRGELQTTVQRVAAL
jgi:hypothetical protein